MSNSEEKMFPRADEQEKLREHFLSLREKCKDSVQSHEEEFAEPMGEELI